MDEAFYDGVDAERLRDLNARRDLPGIVRLAVQLMLLIGSVVLIVLAPTSWMLAVGLVVHTLAQVPFFATLHECGHRTAFRTNALNHIGGWVASSVQFMAPAMFRQFHFAHHRNTHDLASDPELAGFEIQARWPRGIFLLATASGLPILMGRVFWLILTAVNPPWVVWQKAMPFVRENRRRGVVWSSRLLVSLHAGFVTAGILLEPRLLLVYAAVIPAHGLLSLYVSCEHRGLPSGGTILERTRSLDPGPLVKWFMWNMPYHAEHHAYPAIPFHALPALHEEMLPQLVHSRGGVIGLFLRGGK